MMLLQNDADKTHCFYEAVINRPKIESDKKAAPASNRDGLFELKTN